MLTQFRQRFPTLTGKGFQLVAGDGEVLLGDDQVHPGQVIGGLRLFHFGGRYQAHFEAFVGLLQLPGDGLFLGLGRHQGVPGPQHAEVALSHAQYEILTRLLEFSLGGGDHGLGFLEAIPGVQTEQRLRQRYRGGFRVVLLVEITFLDVPVGAVAAVAGIDGGEQRRPALHQRFLLRFPGLPLGAPGAVVIPGGIGDLFQVGGLGAHGQQGDGQGQRFQRAPLHMRFLPHSFVPACVSRPPCRASCPGRGWRSIPTDR